MKIVSRAELMKMPNGTVYAEYEPCVFRGLNVKVEAWEVDWLYDSLDTPLDWTNEEPHHLQCEKAERGEQVPLNFEITTRDGMFNDEQLYAVWSKDDVKRLIARLQKALTEPVGEEYNPTPTKGE